jgi:hypothetical protein
MLRIGEDASEKSVNLKSFARYEYTRFVKKYGPKNVLWAPAEMQVAHAYAYGITTLPRVIAVRVEIIISIHIVSRAVVW